MVSRTFGRTYFKELQRLRTAPARTEAWEEKWSVVRGEEGSVVSGTRKSAKENEL